MWNILSVGNSTSIIIFICMCVWFAYLYNKIVKLEKRIEELEKD